jgi:PhzF family phenazine biosynthesis protein
MNKKSFTIYQIDAFTGEVFKGNPAAVVPLKEWLSDELLLQIAMENNLSETAFYVPQDEFFEIRWFTPEVEVELCGHATLSAAHVIFQHEKFLGDQIIFKTKHVGQLKVSKNQNSYTMDFPQDSLVSIPLHQIYASPFSSSPLEVWKGKSDYLLVFENEEVIKNMKVSISELKKIEARGVIVSAPGESSDFVSRFFGPRVGVDEDPVTGSAHTSLAVYWSKRLNKNKLTAVQVSKRSGEMVCEIVNDRVFLTGEAITYLKGEIWI